MSLQRPATEGASDEGRTIVASPASSSPAAQGTPSSGSLVTPLGGGGQGSQDDEEKAEKGGESMHC